MKREPYKIPRDELFASFSGGRSSAVMLWEMIRMGNLPRAAIFANTGMETAETLDFVFAVEDNILKPAGVPLFAIEYKLTDEGKQSWREVNRDTLDTRGGGAALFYQTPENHAVRHV